MKPAASRSVLATLSTAGDSKHVEVAHQVAFQLWIWVRDDRRQDEFDDQQTAVLRSHGNDRAAVLENRDCVRVPTPVQNMFKHVDIGAGGDRLRKARGCGNTPLPFRRASYSS
jgi:hypothetical protein